MSIEFELQTSKFRLSLDYVGHGSEDGRYNQPGCKCQVILYFLKRVTQLPVITLNCLISYRTCSVKLRESNRLASYEFMLRVNFRIVAFGGNEKQMLKVLCKTLQIWCVTHQDNIS